jgi:2'-5' RNA ligase
MTYLVALLLPDELSKLTERLQHQFQSPRWHIALPPHITFFYEEDDDEEKLREKIRSVCQQTAPIPISIRGLGQFKRQDICIYASVHRTPEVVDLYSSLNNLRDSPVRALFTPHITLSNRLPRNVAPTVYAALQRKGIVGSFIATECNFYRRQPGTKEWQLIEIFSFSLDSSNENRVK